MKKCLDNISKCEKLFFVKNQVHISLERIQPKRFEKFSKSWLVIFVLLEAYKLNSVAFERKPFRKHYVAKQSKQIVVELLKFTPGVYWAECLTSNLRKNSQHEMSAT